MHRYRQVSLEVGTLVPRHLVENKNRASRSVGAVSDRRPSSSQRGYTREYKAIRPWILKRDGYRCRVCGRGEPEVRVQVDHIVAVSEGGHPYDPANLQVLCVYHNLAKRSIGIGWQPRRPGAS